MLRRSIFSTVLLGMACLGTPGAVAGNGTFDQGVFRFRVSIDESVAESKYPAIEAAFESASNALHAMTGGRHVFGEVLVCSSAAKQEAEFWITKKFLSRATHSGYGTPGQHVILNLEELTNPAVGDTLILHEFAHHAYGLFDEYVGPRPEDVTGPWDPANPPFASSDPKNAYNWHLAVCINEYLALSPADQLTAITPIASCLTPLGTGHQPGQPICLMENFHCAATYGATPNGAADFSFCHAGNHNMLNNPGETWQEFIHHQSCWTAIHQSPYPLDNGFAPNQNVFQWIETGEARRFVLVIDRSSSMSGTSIELAKKGAKIFVNPMTKDDEIGVVAFSDSASTIFGLSSMNGANKNLAKTAIDTLNAGGGTDIGDGLEAGLQMLQGAGSSFCARAILLLSDGMASTPTAVIQALKNAQVPVCTIGLGSSVADDLMQEIATETGGVFIKVPEAAQLTSLFGKHAAWLKQQGVFQEKEGLIAAGHTKTLGATVDPSTTSATFIASWDSAADDVTVTLRDPDGETYDGSLALTTSTAGAEIADGVDYFEDDSSATYVVTGDALVAGKWKINLQNHAAATPYDFIGLSDSSTIQLSIHSDKGLYVYPEPMTIFATAHFGAALTNIVADGVVVRPDGSEAEIKLYDDGGVGSGDELAGDGIYAGRFTGWNLDGAYTIKVSARSMSNGKLVAAERFGLSTSEPKVQSFERNAEFSVLANGTLPVSLHNLLVKTLKIHVDSLVAADNSMKVVGNIDLDQWSVNPLSDTLTIRVGNQQYTIPASILSKVGKKNRYVFDTGLSGFSGFVDLFKYGSSLGSFKLKDREILATSLGSLSPIDCRFRFGAMDETVEIAPLVDAAQTGASFTDASSTVTNLFFVTSVKASVKSTKENKDKLSVRAKVGGGYSPDLSTTTLGLGSYSISIAPTSWSKSNNGVFTYQSTLNGANVSVVFDSELAEFSFKASNIDLTGFSNPMVVEIDSGSYQERSEIHLSSTPGTNKVIYIY